MSDGIRLGPDIPDYQKSVLKEIQKLKGFLDSKKEPCNNGCSGYYYFPKDRILEGGICYYCGKPIRNPAIVGHDCCCPYPREASK